MTLLLFARSERVLEKERPESKPRDEVHFCDEIAEESDNHSGLVSHRSLQISPGALQYLTSRFRSSPLLLLNQYDCGGTIRIQPLYVFDSEDQHQSQQQNYSSYCYEYVLQIHHL